MNNASPDQHSHSKSEIPLELSLRKATEDEHIFKNSSPLSKSNKKQNRIFDTQEEEALHEGSPPLGSKKDLTPIAN